MLDKTLARNREVGLITKFREGERETETETDRESDRERDRETDRERQTNRQTDRDTDTERQRENFFEKVRRQIPLQSPTTFHCFSSDSGVERKHTEVEAGAEMLDQG